MGKLCVLSVKNKKDATIVVANSIIESKMKRDVTFNLVRQLQDALSAERNGLIKIEGNIPKSVQAMLTGTKVKAKEESVVEEEEVLTEVEVEAEPVVEEVEVEAEAETEAKEVVEEVKEEVVEVVEEVEEDKAVLSREEVIAFTVKEMREFIRDNNYQVHGSSKMVSRDLTNAILDILGYDNLTEEEN